MEYRIKTFHAPLSDPSGVGDETQKPNFSLQYDSPFAMIACFSHADSILIDPRYQPGPVFPVAAAETH